MTSLDPATWDQSLLHSLMTSVSFGPKPLARGTHTAVSTHHPLSTYAGSQVLQAGGTVADALVTMASVDIVVLPGTSTLGGTMAMVLHEATTAKTYALNAGLNSILDDTDEYNHIKHHNTGRAVLVPGMVAGLEAAWKRFGKLPWADLWQPAIYFARSGFTLYDFYCLNMQRRQDVLLRYPEGRAIFAPDGQLPQPGSTFCQPVLAETLEQLARQGAASMYHGTWGEQLVAAVQKIGGKMRMEDLHRYRVRWDEPLIGSYLGYEVQASNAPHYGGPFFLFELAIAEALDLHNRPARTVSARTLFEEIQIFKRASNTPSLLIDPQHASAQELAAFARTFTREYIQQEAAHIRASDSIDRGRTTPTHSHHVTAIDSTGNMLSAIHTVESDSWGDTGLFVGGIALNSTAFQLQFVRPQPGERIVEPLSVYIALRDGKPCLAAGAISSGALGANLQNTINVLGRGMSLDQSVMQPRWGNYQLDMETMTESATIEVEDGFASAIIQEVQAMGMAIVQAPGIDSGIWTAVGIDTISGERIGAADPRLIGTAIGR